MMKTLYDDARCSLPPVSRRRTPRVDVGDGVWSRALAPASLTVLAVRDVGFRGFAIETAEPVAVRLRARFAFGTGEGLSFEAVAVAVHCHRSLTGDGRWISGWEFPEQPGLDAAIERLMDDAVGILTIV
jgi:hypothetical protein